MQWKPKVPEDNEVRTRLKFAVKPIRCDDGTFVWLEHYRIIEQWHAFYDQWAYLRSEPIPPTKSTGPK